MNAAERAETESRRNEKVYAALSRVYDAGFDWALGPGRRVALEALHVGNGDRLLEVGVGTGLSFPFYPRGCRVTGIDISEPMLDQARDRARELGLDRIDLRLMDARDLTFPDGTFDCVLAPYVVSVVPEPERVLAEMRRVCRPGGEIVIVNHFHNPNPLIGLFERTFTPVSRWLGFRMDLPVETVLDACGLEVLSVDRVNLFGWWRLIRLRRVAGRSDA